VQAARDAAQKAVLEANKTAKVAAMAAAKQAYQNMSKR
jgi:hypothetical protein